MLMRQPMLPASDNRSERGHLWRKIKQKVNVVGHENGQAAIPNLFFVSKTDRIEDYPANARKAKMVVATRLRANRHEVFSLGTDPFWGLVVETLSILPVHIRSEAYAPA